MPRTHLIAAVVGCALLAAPLVAQTLPATTQVSRKGTLTNVATATTAPAEWIPRGELEAIYRRELGAKYDPAQSENLYQVHQLVERYFATNSAEDRKAITKWIATFGLDPNVVGRICRVRMDWPALEQGVYYVNDKVGPHDVHYFLGVPKGYDRGTPRPLVIMLPVATPFATDPPPDADAVAKIYTTWINEELAKHPDALVMMPLLNLVELWGPSYNGMNSVIQAMHHVAGRANVDPARVDLIGHSMSAHATWNLGLHYTTYFAALNPMAGAASSDWQRLRLMNLRNTYAVVWHDLDDKVLKVEQSRAIVNVLRRFKYDVDYTETKGLGHAPTAQVVEDLYQKVRGRTRDLYPKEVSIQSNRPDSIFNRLDWVQMYQPLNGGGDKRLLIRRGTGTIMVYGNTMSVQASIKPPNRIELKTDNVESLRVYLNDQLIDFAKPVTLVVNTKVRFEGMLRPNIDEMLKDQLFLGRGWRYFTGVMDLDFGAPATKPTTGAATRPATLPSR